jgi:hypothetical protein
VGVAPMSLGAIDIGATPTVASYLPADDGDVPVDLEPGDEPVSLSFRAWNLGTADQPNTPCFWFEALLSGLVGLRDGQLTVDLQSIRVTDASILPELMQGVSAWRQAEFVERSERLIERTLREPRIDIPGATLTLAPKTLGRSATTLSLRSKVALTF